MKNLFTLIFTLVAMSLMAQEVYFTESFEDGLPENWTAEGEWMYGAPAAVSSAYFGIPDPSTGNIVVFNDDALGDTHAGSGVMTTSAIDLTGATGDVFLEFLSYFTNNDGYGDEMARIGVSTNGKTFTEIANLEGGSGFDPLFIDISEYAGMTITLQFTFGDSGGWTYGWAFDEILIGDQITLSEARAYTLSAGTASVLDEAQEGIDYIHEGFVINNGYEAITSYDVTMTVGTETFTKSMTGLEVPENGVSKYKMDDAIVVEGNQAVTVEISNVNGDASADLTPENNTASFNLNAYSALNPDRGVFAEEATGTWCTWCPRGTANMDEMSKRFPDNFVGVAVHNGDPMTNAEYDGALTSFPGFQGFPSVVLERNSIIDPGMIPASTLSLMNQAPPAALTVGAEVDGNSITTSIRVDFLEEVAEAHNVAIIITEDGVTGSDADNYFQVNAYSGGGQGPMGGFEFLSNPAPASFNVFNHVGRALVGGWNGNAEALDAEAYSAGMSDGWVFDAVTLPAGTNMDNLHVIGVLINAAGEVVNATGAKVLDAASNGLYSSVSTKDVFDATIADIFPNPVKEVANIVMNLEASVNVSVNVINSLGQTVSTRNYGEQAGNFQLQQDMSNLAEGMYMIHITAGDRFISKKINKVN